MKANELRIGNLITSKMSGVLTVQMIPIDIDMSRYEQIPLTEEWLLKFGFEKKNHIWSDKSVSEGLFFKNKYFIEISLDGFLFCELHYSGQGWFMKTIKHVHQLQNLYFALVGSELQLLEADA